MQIQLFSYTRNIEQEYKFCSITTIQPKIQFFVNSQINNLICNTKLEKKNNQLSKISLATTTDLSVPTQNSGNNAQINIQQRT